MLHDTLKKELHYFFAMNSIFAPIGKIPGCCTVIIPAIVIIILSAIVAVAWLEKPHVTPSPSANSIVAACGEKTDLACLRETIMNLIQTNGLRYGFLAIDAWYARDPSFRPDCHAFAMRIGAELYRSVPDYKSLAFTPESVLCNFGLFQEYPHALLLETGDREKARAFCEYVGERLNEAAPNAEAECFRGIGRGLPFSDPDLKGDALAMAAFAVKECGQLAPKTGNSYKYCLSGVFNSLAREMAAQKFGLSVDSMSPMTICDSMEDTVKQRCLGNLKWTVVSLLAPRGSRDGVDALPRVEAGLKMLVQLFGAQASDYAMPVAWTLSYEQARRDTAITPPSFDAAIKECSALSLALAIECIRGYAVGLAKHGEPLAQHEQVFEFCSLVEKAAPSIQAVDCLSPPMRYLEGFYRPSYFLRVCNKMKNIFAVSCEKLQPDA